MSYQVIKGSAHSIPAMADRSVHLICCSPPYFNLRAYNGDQSVEWPTVEYSPMPGLPAITIPAQRSALGLEKNIESYIGHLILVLREMHRVLRDDGSLWVNLGDSYAGSGGEHTFDHASPGLSKSASRDGVHKYQPDGGRGPVKGGQGLKPKDMMMIPARFALAAQGDGWYIRAAMPWVKRNPMPESTKDRPNTVVEWIYLLAKSESYYFDMEAVKQPMTEDGKRRNQSGWNGNQQRAYPNGDQNHIGDWLGSEKAKSQTTRHLRALDIFFKTWQGLLSNDEGDPLAMIINPNPYSGAHFACFPELLPEIAIKAGSSQYGCCNATVKKLKLRDDLTPAEREKVMTFLQSKGLA